MPCPDCGQPTKRIWVTKPPDVIQDSMHHWQTNGLKEPRLFTSKQERARWMKENGFREFVRHQGVDGTDKSPHTTRWATMDQQTLDNARELLERSAQQPARNEPRDDEMHVTHTYGTAYKRNGRIDLVPDGK